MDEQTASSKKIQRHINHSKNIGELANVIQTSWRLPYIPSIDNLKYSVRGKNRQRKQRRNTSEVVHIRNSSVSFDQTATPKQKQKQQKVAEMANKLNSNWSVSLNRNVSPDFIIESESESDQSGELQVVPTDMIQTNQNTAGEDVLEDDEEDSDLEQVAETANPEIAMHGDDDVDMIFFDDEVNVGVNDVTHVGSENEKKRAMKRQSLAAVPSNSEVEESGDVVFVEKKRKRKTRGLRDSYWSNPDGVMFTEGAGINEKDMKELERVRVWLSETVGLSVYYDNFASNGYEKLDIIKEIQDIEELIEIDIVDKEHQRKFMKAIENLK